MLPVTLCRQAGNSALDDLLLDGAAPWLALKLIRTAFEGLPNMSPEINRQLAAGTLSAGRKVLCTWSRGAAEVKCSPQSHHVIMRVMGTLICCIVHCLRLTAATMALPIRRPMTSQGLTNGALVATRHLAVSWFCALDLKMLATTLLLSPCPVQGLMQQARCKVCAYLGPCMDVDHLTTSQPTRDLPASATQAVSDQLWIVGCSI